MYITLATNFIRRPCFGQTLICLKPIDLALMNPLLILCLLGAFFSSKASIVPTEYRVHLDLGPKGYSGVVKIR